MILDAWARKEVSPVGSLLRFGVIPYAADKESWTEEQLTLFDYVELALGNREELTPEEVETRKAASKVEQAMIEGGDWLSILEEQFESGADIDDIDIDEEMVRQIEEQFNFEDPFE